MQINTDNWQWGTFGSQIVHINEITEENTETLTKVVLKLGYLSQVHFYSIKLYKKIYILVLIGQFIWQVWAIVIWSKQYVRRL